MMLKTENDILMCKALFSFMYHAYGSKPLIILVLLGLTCIRARQHDSRVQRTKKLPHQSSRLHPKQFQEPSLSSTLHGLGLSFLFFPTRFSLPFSYGVQPKWPREKQIKKMPKSLLLLAKFTKSHTSINYLYYSSTFYIILSQISHQNPPYLFDYHFPSLFFIWTSTISPKSAMCSNN